MRFGIVPLEFRPTAEQIIVDGVPDFTRFDIVEIIRQACQIEHINIIEITMDIQHIIPSALTDDTIKQLVDLSDELGISYTVHLPLWSLEPASFNDHIRSASVLSIVEAIRLVKPLQPESYVLHATGALAAEFSRLTFSHKLVRMICQVMASFAAKSIEEIISKSEIEPRLLAIENVEFPFEITRELVDEYNTGICFDTGHLLTRYSGTESVLDFYRHHRDRIVEIHLHDGGYSEYQGTPIHMDHIALGRGELPIREFLSELIADKFNGPVVFELTTDETRESLEVIRKEIPAALNQ